MPRTPPKLHMLCGKIASGKSTLASRLGRAEGTVLISEDAWLGAVFIDDIETGADYLRLSSRLRFVMGPHVLRLLDAGVSVVLDFPANTVEQRGWMRGILDRTEADHELHLLDVPDEICLARLRERNATGAHPFAVTEEQFHRFSSHFAAPTRAEGFNVVRHDGTG